MAHLAAFEDHVVHAVVGEVLACRQAGGARPDDDDRGLAGAHAVAHLLAVSVRASSTVTFVELATRSNTAERFWDWATMASMSARAASASTSYRTRMPPKPLCTSGVDAEDALNVHVARHRGGDGTQLH